MEIKNITVEIKADAEARTIEGFGSVFGNVDQGGDIVLPGAFAKSIAARKPKMLWQHKSDHVIGVWDEVRETGEGLYMKGRLLKTTLGNDAYELAQHGAIDGLSIGYVTKDSEIDRKSGTRKLKALELHEVSLVTFPMNEKAGITRVKSTDGTLMTEREFEAFLRDVGELSQKEAKIVLSEGYKALLNHRDGDGEDALINLLNQFKL